MADVEEDIRVTAMRMLRGKAIALGNPTGNLVAKALQMVSIVIQQGMEDELVIMDAITDLNVERELCDRTAVNKNGTDEVVCGFVDAVCVMIESILAEKRFRGNTHPYPTGYEQFVRNRDGIEPARTGSVNAEGVHLITMDDEDILTGRETGQVEPSTKRRRTHSVEDGSEAETEQSTISIPAGSTSGTVDVDHTAAEMDGHLEADARASGAQPAFTVTQDAGAYVAPTDRWLCISCYVVFPNCHALDHHYRKAHRVRHVSCASTSATSGCDQEGPS